MWESRKGANGKKKQNQKEPQKDTNKNERNHRTKRGKGFGPIAVSLILLLLAKEKIPFLIIKGCGATRGASAAATESPSAPPP